jgi:hypothetical protein
MVVLATLGVAACGSSAGSSGDPKALLTQTFSGTHKVTSGVLNVSLTIDASGSSVLNGPITVSFGGPFQTRGAGKLPESNFVVSGSALGRSVSLGILSTGTKGYVTLQGTSYQLPAATFQKLESSFSQLSSTPGASNGSLAKLGIHPLKWLTNPTIVGPENVGGAPTTHIRSGVNVDALLTDLNTFIQKASSASNVAGTQSLKSGLPPATRAKIAAEVKHPSVDVWTGTNDKTVRRVTIALTVPVTGKTSTQLGGVTSADIGLTLQYSDLNQPQTITPPTTVRPFGEFQTKVSGFLQTLQGATSGALGGSGSSSGTTPSTGTSTTVQKYSDCIQKAAGDVAKMQKCASLLSSGG